MTLPTFSAANIEQLPPPPPSAQPNTTALAITGLGPVKHTSTEIEVEQIISALPFLKDTDLKDDLKGIDGEMLLQITTAAECKELLPKLSQRQAVLLTTKIKAWVNTRPLTAAPQPITSLQRTDVSHTTPSSRSRSRSRSRSPRGHRPETDEGTGNDQGKNFLRKFVTQILNAGEEEEEDKADEAIANRLQELKESIGLLDPELLPPKQTMKRLLGLKRKSKKGVLTDFVELKKFLPPSVASNQDPGVPHTLSIQAMGIAYVLTGTWSVSQMLQYTNTVLRVAASDGWTVAVHYDAVVRKRWAARSLAESWAKLPGEQTALDWQSLDQARGLSRRRGGQTGGQMATRTPQGWRDIAMKEGLCIGFSKDGQRGCPKLAGACKYHHRCGICRSQFHGTAQHRFPQQIQDAGKPTQSGATPGKPYIPQGEHTLFDPGGTQGLDGERLTQILGHMDEARRTPIPNMAAERDNGELTALLHYIAENDSTIQQERETAILQWEALAQSPEILSRNDNIVANAPEHVKPATQHMNLALLAAMILEAGHDDYTLADEIARGLRLTGDLSSNGVYAPKHDKHKTYIDKDEALAEAQHKRAEMARGREQTEGPYTEVLWKQANEDVTSRKLLGPLNESEMDRVFGGKWLYSHRFPKPEPTKVRAIDDLTKSTVNDMCQINERLYLDDIDSLIALAHTARKADQALNVTHRQYLLWRGDHRDAYRQFPISPEDYSVASIRLPVPRTSQVTPAAQHQAFFIHLRLPFGARGSMLHYTRVGRAVCSILRNIMKIPLLAYVDDYYTLCPVEHAYQCQDIFKRVNDMLRFQIKHEKTMDPTPHGKLLGIELHISPSHISMGIDEDRRSKLKSEIRDVLKQGRLSSTRSSKLAGKLGFAGTAFWGKNGRAYLRALYDRAAGGPPAFTEGHPIARALTWFEWALDNCPRRRIPLGIDQEIITIYTDA
ncbi:hypothetical protein FOL47_000630, partial [Perkinsus chesapeaki]